MLLCPVEVLEAPFTFVPPPLSTTPPVPPLLLPVLPVPELGSTIPELDGAVSGAAVNEVNSVVGVTVDGCARASDVDADGVIG